MNWIKFEPEKLNFIDIDGLEDNRQFYVFRYKDKFNFINYFIGKLYKHPARRKTTEKRGYPNGIMIVFETEDAKQWASNECPFGKYCDEVDVDIKYITHYMPLPKESDELD